MWINSIGNSSCFFYTNGNTLSEQIRKKLLALGIDPNTVKSETEAISIIRNIENNKAVQKIDNESNSKNTCTAEEELKTKKQNEENIYLMLKMTANVNKFILGL